METVHGLDRPSALRIQGVILSGVEAPRLDLNPAPFTETLAVAPNSVLNQLHPKAFD